MTEIKQKPPCVTHQLGPPVKAEQN